MGMIETDVIDRVISIASLALSAVTSLFAGYIAFVTLRFTATPKVRIELLNARDSNGRLSFEAASGQTFRFMITNIGQWYAKPAARRIHMFVSFQVGCKP